MRGVHNEWDRFADEVDGKYEYRGSVSRGFRVTAPFGPWHIVFTYYERGVDPLYHKFLIIRAPYVATETFHFTIHPSSLLSSAGKLLGMQDIRIGDPEFDAAFVVKGSDVAKVEELFADAELRQLLLNQLTVHLTVLDKEGLITRNLRS